MSSALREARLRQEYGKLYPGLTPGTWLPAREVADDHFEFRGGDTDPRPSRNERREDREAH
jgi:hypothetical protein